MKNPLTIRSGWGPDPALSADQRDTLLRHLYPRGALVPEATDDDERILSMLLGCVADYLFERQGEEGAPTAEARRQITEVEQAARDLRERLSRMNDRARGVINVARGERPGTIRRVNEALDELIRITGNTDTDARRGRPEHGPEAKLIRQLGELWASRRLHEPSRATDPVREQTYLDRSSSFERFAYDVIELLPPERRKGWDHQIKKYVAENKSARSGDFPP